MHAKLVRRHPHVFGEAEAKTAGRVRSRWEEIKSEQEGREGIFHDVPASLPGAPASQEAAAPRRRRRLRLARPRTGRSRRSDEELGELEAEVARAGEPSPETEPDAAVAHEVGDLLFTVVNLARRLNVDPELALRATNSRFVAASSAPRSSRDAQGERWSELPLEEQDRYYDQAKEQLG